ncbi:MAG: Gfo/Idh/MocA family oxidoreductase [Alphaproteobacteria bacterium]|nr:Gfo/Idh/MocA family oxidoreductase [Alphaproteobacteria bacterium]
MARTGLIGCGMWGRNLARNLSQLGALASVADRDAENATAFADEFGGKADSIDAVLEQHDLDGIIIATPAFTHADLACRALAAGRHVYVEKPLAMSLDEANRIAAAARDARRVVMVGHLIRYHQAFITLQQEIASGRIGKVQHVMANRLAMGRIRSNESVIHDLCPHDTSLLLALMGEEPTSVSCAGASHITPGIVDHVSAMFAFSDERTAAMNISWISPYKEHRLTVIGSSGSIVFDDSRPWAEKLTLFRDDIQPQGDGFAISRSEPVFLPVDESEPLKQEVASFIDCCNTGKVPPTDLTEALAVQRVLEQMHMSISSYGRTDSLTATKETVTA